MAEDIQWLNAESGRDSGSFKFHAVNDKCIKCVRALGLACDTCFGVGYIDTVDRVTKMPNLHRCEICKGTGLK